MVGLVDIAPQSRIVHGVDVFGISAEGLVSLFRRFPQLANLSLGKGIKVDEIMEIAPDSIAAIIAAGTGAVGDDAAEKVAAKFPIEMQLDFLTEIGGLTFPGGFGPFMDRLSKLSVNVAQEVSKVRDTKSPQQ